MLQRGANISLGRTQSGTSRRARRLSEWARDDSGVVRGCPIPNASLILESLGSSSTSRSFSQRRSFSGMRTGRAFLLKGPSTHVESRESGPGRRPRLPRLLEKLHVRPNEIRTVRPKGSFSVAANRPLVLDQERENRFPVDDGEPTALSPDVPERNIPGNLRHKGGVRFVDVRQQFRLHAPAHRRNKDLIQPRPVGPLDPLRSREGKDLLLRRSHKPAKCFVDLTAALNHLKPDRSGFAALARQLGPRLQDALPNRVEALQLGALLLLHHVEDLVQGPRRVSLRPVQGHLDEPPPLQAFEGAIGLYPVHPT